MISYRVAILCVFGLAVGQILLKMSCLAMTEMVSFLEFES